MKKCFATLSLLAASLSTGGVAWAHPGHGVDGGHGGSLLHYLTSPLHLLTWLALASALVVAYQVVRYVQNRRQA